jgi:hypothetical protein
MCIGGVEQAMAGDQFVNCYKHGTIAGVYITTWKNKEIGASIKKFVCHICSADILSREEAEHIKTIQPPSRFGHLQLEDVEREVKDEEPPKLPVPGTGIKLHSS